MPRLLLATTNKGKAAEYRDLLKGLDFEIVTLDQAGISQEADESYNTFEENARHKAAFYAELGRASYFGRRLRPGSGGPER